MKNDTRNDVFTRNSRTVLLGRVFLCTLPCLVINQVWADVPPPPPSYHKPIDTSFPSGRALERQGYDPKTGVWKVNVNKTGKPTVTSNGSTVTGSQNVRITATDGYGNKATIRGKVTQTETFAKPSDVDAVQGVAAQRVQTYHIDRQTSGQRTTQKCAADGGFAKVSNRFKYGNSYDCREYYRKFYFKSI